MYSFTVLEGRSPKSRYYQTMLPPNILEKNLSLRFPGGQQALVFLRLQLHYSGLWLASYGLPLCGHLCEAPPLLMRTLVIGFRSHPHQYDSSLPVTLANTISKYVHLLRFLMNETFVGVSIQSTRRDSIYMYAHDAMRKGMFTCTGLTQEKIFLQKEVLQQCFFKHQNQMQHNETLKLLVAVRTNLY